MATKKVVNWEKIGIYVTLLTGFWMIVGTLFKIKDDQSVLKERIAKLEVRIEVILKETIK